MSDSLDERDRTRTAMLLALYEMVDGNTAPSRHVSRAALHERLGLAESEGHSVFNWLKDRGLAETVTFTSVAITARGVDAAEKLLRNGASVPYSVVVLSADEQRAVEGFLTAYRAEEDRGELVLGGDASLEADAEVRTIEAQLRSPKPKRRVIVASLRELHALLQGVGASAAFELLKQLLFQVL